MTDQLYIHYPALSDCRADIDAALALLVETFQTGNKLLLCGNGGSCADCDHISGELLKGFLKRRPLSTAVKASLRERCPQLAEDELDALQGGLPCIPLPSLTAVQTAFGNDVSPQLCFAQAVLALGRPGDALLCLSTSGSSGNVVAAAKVARGQGLRVVSLTGEGGGLLRALSDVCIAVPAAETYRVQEYHLPVYHALCAAVEEAFFAE